MSCIFSCLNILSTNNKVQDGQLDKPLNPTEAKTDIAASKTFTQNTSNPSSKLDSRNIEPKSNSSWGIFGFLIRIFSCIFGARESHIVPKDDTTRTDSTEDESSSTISDKDDLLVGEIQKSTEELVKEIDLNTLTAANKNFDSAIDALRLLQKNKLPQFNSTTFKASYEGKPGVINYGINESIRQTQDLIYSLSPNAYLKISLFQGLITQIINDLDEEKCPKKDDLQQAIHFLRALNSVQWTIESVLKHPDNYEDPIQDLKIDLAEPLEKLSSLTTEKQQFPKSSFPSHLALGGIAVDVNYKRPIDTIPLPMDFLNKD